MECGGAGCFEVPFLEILDYKKIIFLLLCDAVKEKACHQKGTFMEVVATRQGRKT